MMMSLLDIAVKKSGESNDCAASASDGRTLIFAGGKFSGKTSMIQRFLDKNDPVKETLALEYTFGRKSGHSLNKELCHIWELGGGIVFTHLLPTVLGGNFKELTMILALDLSNPKTLWLTLETIIETLYNQLTRVGGREVSKSAMERFPKNHEDADLISQFPIPLVIVGSKYDLFVTLDPEEQKIISRSLRLVAHSLGACLFYYSDKDPSLVKKLKELLNSYGFGGAAWKTFSNDPSKPLSIPCGADSFQQIGSSSVPTHPQAGVALDVFKHAFTSHFPQEKKDMTIPGDPCQDRNFHEPEIDNLRVQKQEEIERSFRKSEQKRRN